MFWWGDLIQFHGFIYHLYADNFQISASGLDLSPEFQLHTCHPTWISNMHLDLTHLTRKFLIFLLPSRWTTAPPFIFLGFTLWSSYWFLFYLYPTFAQSENVLALCPECPLLTLWSELPSSTHIPILSSFLVSCFLSLPTLGDSPISNQSDHFNT